MLDLRTSLEPSTTYLNRPAAGLREAYMNLDPAGASSVRRGWVSAGIGEDANDLLALANEAAVAGDMQRAQALEQQGRDSLARAQTWAPTTQNFTEIDGLRAAGDWLGGQVGNIRSSAPPLLGGLGGAVVGGLGGLAVGGPAGAALGARAGAGLGAGAMGYDMEANEAIGQAMMDPTVRATRTPQEILDAGRAKGVVAGALEAVVPMGVANSLVLGGAKRAGAGALKSIGKRTAVDAGEEFLTEGAQELTGQAAQNYLRRDDLTNFDYEQAFNAAAGGAVGGGMMGAAGGIAEAGRNKLGETAGTVGDVARDPVGAVIDKMKSHADAAGRKQAQEDIATNDTSKRTLEALHRQAAEDSVYDTFTSPVAQDAKDEEVSANMRAEADRWADRVLTSQARTFGPRESTLREAAARYKSDGDWMAFRSVLKKHDLVSKQEEMRASFEPEGVKSSEMTPEGEELNMLSQAWLQNEGKRYGTYFDDSDEAKGLGAKLFAWIKNDFGKTLTEDGEMFIPKAFVEALGDRAPGVVESAITAARKEGWNIKDAGDAVQTLREYVSSNEGDVTALKSALRYSQEKNWSPKMIQQFAKELRAKGGQLDKEDYKWFKTQVGDAPAVLKHFQKPSRFYKAENRLKAPSSNEELQTDLGFSTDASNATDSGSDITENDGGWLSGVSEIEVEGGRKVRFVGADKDSYPFDISNEEQLSALRAKVSTLANDPAVFAKEIGVWQQAKRAANGNKALLAEYEAALIREHGNSLSEGNFQGDMNPVDLTDAERSSILGQINKRFRSVEVEGVVADKDPHKIAKEEVKSFRVDSVTNNIRSPEKETAKNGFIFLERNIGGKISYFPTTTSRLLQHIRGNRRLGKEGAANIEREVKVEGKDAGAAGTLSHLEQAVADLITSDKTFTGRVGYKMRGDAKEPIWIEGKNRLPGFLPLGDSVSTAKDGYRGRRYEAMRKGRAEVEVDDGPKEIATETNVDFTTVSHFATTDPSTGHKIGSKRQAAAVAQALRGTHADVVGPEKRKGQWGVSYNTRVETRSTTNLSEGDEMNISSAKKFERSAREFQEETGLSLAADIPSAMRDMVARVLQNARIAWRFADSEQRKQLKKLIEDKNYFSANKLADTIRFSSEGGENVKVSSNRHEQVPGDARGANKGRHTGVRETESVPRPNPVVPNGDRTRTGTDPQNSKADSDRIAGERDSDKASSTNGSRAQGKADAGNLAKQDAWALKVAALSPKDAVALVKSLPFEKLEKAHDILNGMFPFNTQNAFWQRNALPYDADKLEATVQEAIDKIEDRLYDEAPLDGAKYSEQNTGESSGQTEGQNGEAAGRGADNSPLLGVTGGLEGLIAKHGKAFAGRIAEISRTFRFENPNEQGGSRTRDDAAEGDGRELRESGNSGDVTKNSEQTPSDQTPIDPKQALEDIARILGKDYSAKVVKKLGGKAGVWTKNGIKLAASAPNGTQYHEVLHELFSQMRKHGADNVRQLIERVATNPIILRRLEQLLAEHPSAVKQLKTPEEAAAYLFQFWNMGLISVGPETKSVFDTIKDFLVNIAKDIHAFIDSARREERKAEKAASIDQKTVEQAFRVLAEGNVANPEQRQAVYDALRTNAEMHQKTIDELGQTAEKFWQGFGRYVVSSESMMNLYSKHPELKIISNKFHQMAGKAMENQARNDTLEARGGYFEALHSESQTRLNRFERMLKGYDKGDIELAMKHLENGTTNSADAKVAKLVDDVRAYMSEMYNYMTQSDVRRLDPTSEERWVSIEKRKDYFSQVWDIESLSGDHDGFVAKLLDKHSKELEYMAAQANAEIAAWQKDTTGKAKITSPTVQAQLDKQNEAFMASGKIIGPATTFETVTPEMIAESIYTRLLNSMGMGDIQESEWSLGITPGASAVNRRELNWLDKDAFSEYKSKDLVEIVTTYTRNMVKRAEYQKRFGYGGEVIGDAMDTAFLREMGGNDLVDTAKRVLPMAIKAWKKAAATWHKDNPGVPYPEPFPTLRMVGTQSHRSLVGVDKANQDLIKATKRLAPAVNAVRAMEGTIGNEITPAMRGFNSWVNTYQNVRLLPFALFTNFSDVIGLTVQGGTLGDAWNAFVSGIREVRNTWEGKKGQDADTLRAEDWGVSDAGILLDTLGQNYGSVYMNQKAKRVNDKFFRVIGMEGWNRGVRIAATRLGERIIGEWAGRGLDKRKPGEQARFERLYGKDADPRNIALAPDGSLDTRDPANRAAIQRFVQDAVMSSNAAHRTAWMSDPRFATFAHLKNFAYTFHSVMLKGILAQAAQGNMRPALVAGLGFASISIAAGAVKEMLIPGEEPPWMQGGLDGYLEYGLGQANLGGVPQLWGEGVKQLDPAKLAGPFWDQIQNTITSPIPGLSLNLSPFDGETELLRDRKVAVELAKALPAGNIMGRYMEAALSD